MPPRPLATVLRPCPPATTLRLLRGLVVLAALPWAAAGAQQDVRTGITRYIDEQINISVDRFGGGSRDIPKIIAEDLRFSRYFNVIDADVAGTLVPAGSGSVNYDGWSAFGTRYLVTGTVSGPTIQVAVHDVAGRTVEFSRDYPVAGESDARYRAYVHAISNDIIKELTGEPGMALTKIAFASRRRHEKEIFVADYDGFNSYSVTHTDTINLTPAWSKAGDRICYTTFERGNPDLFCVSSGGGTSTAIATFRGLNIAPSWSPDGTKLAMTLTKDGNPEIYAMDVAARKLTRLTYNLGIDTAPSWAPKGNSIVFESDRAGGPHIYVMDAGGSNVRRISFDTSDNHSPAWSPKGDLIAYVGKRGGGDFQIFMIEAGSGEGLTQLTLTGSNEDPTWSPDGLHLAFSSTRQGRVSNIFTMTWDGQEIRQVTRGGGYITPDWSPLFTTP
ncbi:MAG: Tol-Pal system beta propeller repeat protein TolB [Gemmatimonadetes bacterium]|nr:Tol-Pal system beta propeller repeat protein TolB [Gemmatimonadota bacterium]